MKHERNLEIMKKVSKLKGNSDDDEWLNSKASLIRAVKTLGKPSSVMAYDFKNWMVWRGKEKNVHEETVFVSSNDIACSWFFNITKPNVHTMVFNYRNRIQELTDNFAGNYVTQVSYQTPDYQTP